MTLDKKRAQIIARESDATLGLARLLVAHAKRTKVSLSVLCAVVEQESRFANVFGHDTVANPIKSPPGGVTRVTKARYLAYRRHRDAGLGAQGVGVTQLTAPGLQAVADRLGGCWTMTAQVHVAADLLAALLAKYDLARALAAYNGGETGWRNGLNYSREVRAKADRWHKILTNL